MIGTTFRNYKIIEKLGAGGMGEERDSYLIYMKSYSMFEKLRSNEKFKALLQKVGHSQ